MSPRRPNGKKAETLDRLEATLDKAELMMRIVYRLTGGKTPEWMTFEWIVEELLRDRPAKLFGEVRPDDRAKALLLRYKKLPELVLAAFIAASFMHTVVTEGDAVDSWEEVVHQVYFLEDHV